MIDCCLTTGEDPYLDLTIGIREKTGVKASFNRLLGYFWSISPVFFDDRTCCECFRGEGKVTLLKKRVSEDFCELMVNRNLLLRLLNQERHKL